RGDPYRLGHHPGPCQSAGGQRRRLTLLGSRRAHLTNLISALGPRDRCRLAACLDGGIPNGVLRLYSRSVNEAFFVDLSAWLTQAGLAGASETDIVSGFCDRCVAAGLPLARALLFIDTLHPVHEGRLFRWGYGDSPLLEYGRTNLDALAASGAAP